MATGKSLASDFKVYNAEFQAGLYEGITQFVDVFNGASRNAVRLVTEAQRGHYARDAFFKHMSDLISRRDITSTSSATAQKLEQDEFVSVKLNRKIGPADISLDAVRKLMGTGSNITAINANNPDADTSTISFVLGRMAGELKAKDMLNSGMIAVEAALEGQSSLVYDATGQTTKTITTAHLVSGLALMGDQAERVVAWVMHSKNYFDLVKSQISDKVTNVADQVIYGAVPGTLGRPVIISDIPALHDANGSAADTYNVLGLVADGLVLTESEQSDIVSQVVTGLENLVFRLQGEYAFNVGCKGFQWDVTNGGSNPNDTNLGTTTNWDKVATSVKDCAGVRIKCQ